MSSEYDVFDHLNDYLNKNDDCDFPDEELGDYNDQEPDPEEIPPPIKQKRGANKKTGESDPIPPKRPRRTAAPVNIGSSGDEDDLLSDPPTSSSHSSLQSRPLQQKVVDLAGDDLDEQFNEVQKQYDLIFNSSALVQENRSYFANLQKSWQTLTKKKRSARGRNKAFMKDFDSMKETFYNICINHSLMAPSTVYSAAGPSSAPTRRRRRQQEFELINLVDSPALILPGTINLDSDEDDLPSNNNNYANLSFDSENYEVSLKITWEGKIERFAHRKFQKFADVIAVLAERSGADPNHVVLNLDERIIEPDDTPDSISYRISQFITGRVIRGKLAETFLKKATNATGTAKQKKPMDANVINLKVQSDRWKKSLEVQIGKDQRMMIVVIKCAEELKCKPGDIKLYFDGDPLPMDSTPTDLELDGGEVLDIRFLKG